MGCNIFHIINPDVVKKVTKQKKVKPACINGTYSYTNLIILYGSWAFPMLRLEKVLLMLIAFAEIT